MTAVGVWAVLAGAVVSIVLCVVAAVLAIAWGAPRAWRDVVPLLRHALVVLTELRTPLCARTTIPLPRVRSES